MFTVVLALMLLAQNRGRFWFLVFSLGYMALATGLFTRLDSISSASSILGFQALFSFAAGAGAFRLVLAGITWKDLRQSGPLTVGSDLDSRVAKLNVAICSETIGGSFGIMAAQAVFVSQLSNDIPGTDVGKIMLHSGATNFKAHFTGDALTTAMGFYNKALTRSFFVAAAAGTLPFAPIALLIMPFSIYLLWLRTFDPVRVLLLSD
jgi:hypothetical protein